jgi:hypothetical protein
MTTNIRMEFRDGKINQINIIDLTSEILQILNNSFLFKPVFLDQTDKKEIKISGYTDTKILKAAEDELRRKQYPLTLWGEDLSHSVTFGLSPFKYYFAFTFQLSLTQCNLDLQIKEIFIRINKLLNPNVASIWTTTNSVLLDKYFEWERRTPYFTMFSWLTYFGPEEFRKQGGDAIFENPYIKAEKMGEGVFIQVGESPFDAATPEGEELIVKATRALPPVVK